MRGRGRSYRLRGFVCFALWICGAHHLETYVDGLAYEKIRRFRDLTKCTVIGHMCVVLYVLGRRRCNGAYLLSMTSILLHMFACIELFDHRPGNITLRRT